MDMASSAANGAGNVSSQSGVVSSALPSLFRSEHCGSTPLVGGKDLDGLMAMNDNTLSQQIEFILQDAPMEQEDGIAENIEDDDNEEAQVRNNNMPNTTIKLDNPPNTITTSASEYNHVPLIDEAVMASGITQQRRELYNGSRIIIQTTEAAGIADEEEEEEDPELNDENLQDIEEEAQDVETEDEQQQLQQTQLELERKSTGSEDLTAAGINKSGLAYISTPTITTHHTQLPASQPPQQIVLPAGSIMNASTTRTLTVPVSEALAQLQRRPLYISSTVGGMAGATFVRMPAVISRSPMTVLNVVQQGVPGNGPTTQLILQTTPVSNSGTPVTMVTSNVSAMPTTQASTATPTVAAEVVLPKSAITQAQPLPSIAVPSPSSSITLGSSTVVVARATASSPVGVTNSGTLPVCNLNNNLTNVAPTTYQCVECVEKFESKELFDIHRSGHANNMKCAICNMVLKSLKNYEKHCLRCKPYECQICGRVVRFRPNFIKHMRVHTGQQSERHKYKCDVCHKEFMSFEYFKVHKKIHNENVNLTCEICGKVFSALASLRGHSKLHSGVKLHKCDVCGKGFGQRYNLKIHARTHTGDFPFECKICKKKLHTQSSLQTHMQVHQRDQTAQATPTVKMEQPSSAVLGASTSVLSAPSIIASAVIKIEPQQDPDGPSTSGFQNNLRQQIMHDIDDENSTISDRIQNASGRMVSTITNVIASRNSNASNVEDSSNESSNTSHELKQQRLLMTPARTIVIKNYVQGDQGIGVSQQQLHNQTQVIQSGASSSTLLQQQLLRKTPIIHSTGGATSLSSSLASVVQQTSTSPSLSPSSSSTSCSSSVVVSKTGAPLSLASAALSTSTIRSTRNHLSHYNQSNHHRALTRSNNHRNHHHNHLRRHQSHMEDDDDDDIDDVNSTHPHHTLNANGQHFDDDDDDEKSSPSLATAAIIKIEPNLYSSGSGDNSNEMLIKEEFEEFDDNVTPHSPHSPPSSKYRMSNFDSDLVDHHVDLNHSLPPYGNLFEPHSIPDSIPVQLYPDDDDDFRLDHSSLGGLHNTSSSTTDGDFIKKEWVYGAGSSYTMNGKFGDDSDALCDAANFIYD